MDRGLRYIYCVPGDVFFSLLAFYSEERMKKKKFLAVVFFRIRFWKRGSISYFIYTKEKGREALFSSAFLHLYTYISVDNDLERNKRRERG